MYKCIYLEKEDLTFNSREHVIPAGLGCIDKLPIGVVSDEANNLFSKYEKIFLEESFVGFVRKLNIGKRGNLNKPIPNIVCNFSNNDIEPKLLLSTFDKTYGIPYLMIREDECRLYSPSKKEGIGLLSNLTTITLNTRFNFNIIPNCKSKTLLITFLGNKWYCYHSFVVNSEKHYELIINCIINALSQFINKFNTLEPQMVQDAHKEIYVGNVLNINDEISSIRVLCKMIINTLYYFFGESVVFDPLLKEMKEFCLGKSNNLNVKYSFHIELSDEQVAIHPHKIEFYYCNKWKCKISLFDEIIYDFFLPIDLSNYMDKDEVKKYIVDWQNR